MGMGLLNEPQQSTDHESLLGTDRFTPFPHFGDLRYLQQCQAT